MAQTRTSIPLNSPEIVFKGARYTQYGKPYPASSDKTGPKFVQPQRFSEAVLQTSMKISRFNPQTAQWAAGIEMHLVTNSQNIVMALNILPARRGRPGIFQVYKDGKHFKDYRLKSAKTARSGQIRIQSSDGQKHHYRIMLPATIAIQITSLKIDPDATLSKVTLPSKPVYVAMGDSITHGSAALNGISTRSYPYLLAPDLGYDLYNLGVGGGRVSPLQGTMLKDWEKIEVITLLIAASHITKTRVEQVVAT